METISITVQRYSEAKPITIRAEQSPVAGLAIHPAPCTDELWSITHISSGLAVGIVANRDDAIEVCERIEMFADWTQSANILKAQDDVRRWVKEVLRDYDPERRDELLDAGKC